MNSISSLSSSCRIGSRTVSLKLLIRAVWQTGRILEPPGTRALPGDPSLRLQGFNRSALRTNIHKFCIISLMLYNTPTSWSLGNCKSKKYSKISLNTQQTVSPNRKHWEKLEPLGIAAGNTKGLTASESFAIPNRTLLFFQLWRMMLHAHRIPTDLSRCNLPSMFVYMPFLNILYNWNAIIHGLLCLCVFFY